MFDPDEDEQDPERDVESPQDREDRIEAGRADQAYDDHVSRELLGWE